jgi:hypothetical protein
MSGAPSTADHEQALTTSKARAQRRLGENGVRATAGR